MPRRNIVIRNPVTNITETPIKDEYLKATQDCIVCPNCQNYCGFGEEKLIDKWQTFLLRLKGNKFQVKKYTTYYCEKCGSSWESDRYTVKRERV